MLAQVINFLISRGETTRNDVKREQKPPEDNVQSATAVMEPD